MTTIKYLVLLAGIFLDGIFVQAQLNIQKEFTVDSLGACQGVFVDGKRIFLYGDREVGIIREYRLRANSIKNKGKEIKLTLNEKDVINHPTGIAYRKGFPAFIGNTVRLNKEGTAWKAVIYHIDWNGLLKTRNLQGNLIRTIEDDACIQGTRPEYVKYENKWWVATADYGGKRNEVRLYDPVMLARSSRTTDSGVLYKKFSCSPWVQNLHFVPETGTLILVQNQVEGKKWRLTFLDLEKSIASGKEYVLKIIDSDRGDELEGFSFYRSGKKAIGVTSSRNNNVNILSIE